MKYTLTMTAVLLALCGSLFAQDPMQVFSENPDRVANNMHSYEFCEIHDSPAPKGYKPFYISHYGRHGSRFELNHTFARDAQGAFHILDSLGLLTPAGKKLYGEVEAIVDAHVGMEGSLTVVGAAEHRKLAERMAGRYPTVFKDKARNEVDCFSSTNFRCIMSMCNFTYRLKEIYPRKDFNFTSAQKYMSYINPNLNIRRPSDPAPVRPPFPAGMRFPNPNDPAPKYTPAPGTPGHDFTRFLTPLFTDREAALAVLGNPEPFVRGIFNAGGLCQLLDTDIEILRTHFTTEELIYLWAGGNDSIYRMWGGSKENGETIRYAIIPLLKDFIEKADAAMQPGSHRAADLRFGHDTSVLPLFALLGIDDPQGRILPYKSAHEMGWYAGLQIPMATNCQMIFYRNRRGDVLAKVLYNEKEVLIPGVEPVSGPYYEWDTLKKHFLGLCDKATEAWLR